MRNPDKWKNFAIPTYHALVANGKIWDKNPDMRSPITRIYYDLVWCCNTTNRSGLISKDALREGKSTQDHIYSPQFIARMIMDNRDYFLKDMDVFMETFYESCKTIVVTPSENMRLRNLTLRVPMKKKYREAGIELLNKQTGKEVTNLIKVPKVWEQFEKQYLV
jgi:hypothetical protein